MEVMPETMKMRGKTIQLLHLILLSATNDPGLPDSPNRSDLAVGAAG